MRTTRRQEGAEARSTARRRAGDGMPRCVFLSSLPLSLLLLLAFPLLLLLSASVAAAADPPPTPVEMELGILGAFSGSSATDFHQLGEAAAAIMAMRDINARLTTVLNRTEELGQFVHISFVVNDTKGDTNTAIVTSLWQTARHSVLGIAGEAVSFLCVPVAAVAATGGGGPNASPLASLSQSCTAPVLSDKLSNPTFMRLVPSDSAQGTLLARMIQQFQWQRIAVVTTAEIYGTSVAATMLGALDSSVRADNYTIHTEDRNATATILNQIKASGTHVIVLAMVYWSGLFFEEAAPLGMLSDEYVWLGTDAVVAQGVPAVQAELRNSLQGVLGVVPLLETEEPPYQRFLDSWYKQSITDFPMLPPLPSDIFELPPVSSYAAVAYDVIVAYALAAQLALSNGDELTRASVLKWLKSSDLYFDGVSRSNIRFDDNQDLLPAYSVLNNMPYTTAAGPSGNVNVTMKSIASATVNTDNSIDAATMEQIAREVRFHDGTNRVPYDRNASLLLPLSFLFTAPGPTRPFHIPVTEDGTDCAWLFNSSISEPHGNSTTCFGGVSRRLAYFQNARASRPNVLTVDLGGSWFPSPFYTIDGGSTIAKWLSRLQYDAVALSLQDFVIGASAAEAFFSQLQPRCNSTDGLGSAPGDNPNCVIATTLFNKHPFSSPTLVHRAVVKNVGDEGRQMAFISLQRPDLMYASASADNLVLQPEQVATVQQTINWLNTTQGVNVVVLLCTSGYLPSAVASQLYGVSMIVSLLPGVTQKLWDSRRHSVLVVHATFPNGTAPSVVDVSLQIDEDGRVYLWEVANALLDDDSASDPYMDAQAFEAVQTAEDLQDQSIGVMPALLYGEPGMLADGAQGVVEATLNVTDIAMGATFVFNVEKDGCLVTQCSAGSMVADLLLQYCAQCQIAHIPGNTIGGSVPAGNVTRTMLSSVLPNNTLLVSYEVQGSRLLDTLLLHSISNVGLDDFQQWSGVRFAYHADALGVVGITSCTVRDADGTYRPLQPNGWYTLITTSTFFESVDGLRDFTINQKLYQLQLQDWILLQVSSGAFRDALPILSRNETGMCWNTSFALQSDSVGGFLWPDERCRWITSARQLCPSLEVPTSIVISNQTVDPACRCIASYTRSTTEISGVHPCVHCPATQSKLLVGDHECVCDAFHYLIPKFLRAQPFRCVDPTGYTFYPEPARTNDPCKQCPSSCLGCSSLASHELNASTTASGSDDADTFDAREASFWIQPGWWWDGRSNEVYLCPDGAEQAGNCKGTAASVNPCRVGQSGPLCQQCAKGYGGFTRGTCSPCGEKALSALLLVLSLLVVLFFLLFLLYSAFVPKQRSSDVVKILLRHVQMAAFVGAMRVSDGGVLRAFSSTLGLANTTGVKSLAYTCLGQLDALDHMAISTGVLCVLLVAILGALVTREVRRRCFPSPNDNVQLKVVEPMTFLRTLFCCCIRDKTRYAEDGTELPADGNDVTALGRGASSSVAEDARALGLDDRRLRFKRWSYEQILTPACVILLLYLYPALMVENLSLMRSCLELGGRRYMSEDTSIDCDSSRFKVWFAIAIVRIVVVGFGLPVAILLRIARFQHQLQKEAERSAVTAEPMRARLERSFFMRYRFLFEGYKESEWFWEVITMARHVLLIVVLVFLSQEATSQAAAAAMLFIASLVLHMARRPYRDHEPETILMSARQRVLRSMRQEHEKAAQKRKAMAAWNGSHKDDGDASETTAAPGFPSPSLNAHLASPSAVPSDADAPSPALSEHPAPRLSRCKRIFPLLQLNTIESFSLTLLLVQVILSMVSHADPWLNKEIDSSSVFSSTTGGMQQPSHTESTGRRVSVEAQVLQWLVVLAHILFASYVIIKEWPILWKRGVRLMRKVRVMAQQQRQAQLQADNDERFRGVTVPSSDVALAVIPAHPGAQSYPAPVVPTASPADSSTGGGGAGVRTDRAFSDALESAPVAQLRRRGSSVDKQPELPPGQMDDDASARARRSVSGIEVSL